MSKPYSLEALADHLEDEARRLRELHKLKLLVRDDMTINEAVEAIQTANDRKYVHVQLDVTKLGDGHIDVQWSVYDDEKIKPTVYGATLAQAVRTGLAAYEKSTGRELQAANGTLDASRSEGYAVEPPDVLTTAHAEYVASIPGDRPTLDLIDFAKATIQDPKFNWGGDSPVVSAAARSWLDSLPF